MSHDTGTADRAVDHSDTPADRRFVIGRDVGPVAGWFRIIFGLIAVASLWYRVDKALDGGELAMMVVWFAVVAAVYTAVIWFFGRIDRFRGVSPWIPSALLQLPMMLYPMGIGSDPLHQALAVYTTIGVLLCGVARYGGLEVAALPMLLLGRRTVLYSPFNAVDIVEQAFRREQTRGVMWATSLALTVFVLIEYWWVGLLLSVPPAKDLIGESIRLPGYWALLLLVPAGWFAAHAARGRDRYRTVPLGQRWPGLAAVALLLLIPMLGNRQVPDSLWGIIMFVGLIVGLVTLVRLPFRKASGAGRREVVAPSH
ncbi:DUF6410 domain-containing protein [Micromonospora sagamiensis]|uniref:Uncharacterized protein n=1 Tax=Micromonospora sagamiensis TaxID=47875 RepID=A0A562WIR8_9ACTN|nr:DUF6410 domain-containing protein [Micromonospora sagamiensis]TWJ30200.1 hypothetical protein JD81_03737 [Micromonospora sagamiensis]BCL16770.1 hypothetical protein GCM10017556_45090 [Micromonospora sagamiensis]